VQVGILRRLVRQDHPGVHPRVSREETSNGFCWTPLVTAARGRRCPVIRGALPADRPMIEEIVAVMRAAGDGAAVARLRARS
jgi:hypothetical protein